MENWRRAGEYGDGLLVGNERGIGYVDDVLTQRHGIEVKLAGGAGLGGLRVVRGKCLKHYFDVRNRAVLWIVNDAADTAENRGESADSGN